MNSTAQIAIGTIVLGAAFVIGSQMRSRTASSDAQSENAGSEPSGFVWQKPRYEPVISEAESDHGLIDMPEARKRVPAIPEPAKLNLSNLNGQQQKKQSDAPQQLSNSPPKNEPIIKKAIVEPDFSQLAASFFETNPDQTTLLGNPSESVAPLPRLEPADVNLKTSVATNIKTTPANNIVDKFDIAPRSTSFEANDFEPRFKAAAPPTSNALAFDENQPPLPIEGPGTADSLVMAKPVQHPTFAHKIPLDAENSFPQDQETVNQIPMLNQPQMTSASENRMIEVRSRQTNGLRLETNRFVRHRSKQGETLQRVSRQYYGKPDFYLDIYLANQDVLRNPGRIPTGTSLRIPVYD